MGAMPHMAILAELTSDDVLDTAYGWLCKRRRAYPADAEVWSFRRQWTEEKDRLKRRLAAGRYRFDLLTRKLWNENLFKRTWDHFSAKLDEGP